MEKVNGGIEQFDFELSGSSEMNETVMLKGGNAERIERPQGCSRVWMIPGAERTSSMRTRCSVG